MPSQQPNETAEDERLDYVFQAVVSGPAFALSTYWIIAKDIAAADRFAAAQFGREHNCSGTVQKVERLGFASFAKA